ncbi:MAG: ABC transporter substrate-binding protein, partial [Nocardiopsaceae bacterium]|nr:ABC transporter substrate-binding protein [Nocardiopsaceae bacterium]
MLRIKVRILPLVGTLLLALAAAACGSGGSAGSPGPVTLTYWTTSSLPAETAWIDSHFNAAHKDVKVHGQYLSTADQSTAKIVSAIKSGTEPDLIIGQDPSALPLLAESGKVVDLSSALKPETGRLYPGIRSSLFYQGKQLGMALGGVGDYALFYNKRDFARAGIARPPKTWAELEADAVKLSDPGRHHYGIYIPFGTDEWISYDWESVLWSDGGQVVSSDGTKTAFDSPAGVAALTLWTNLVRKDHAAPATSYAQAGSYDGAPAFASDAVSMIVDGQWALPEVKNIDYGVAPLPAGSSGRSATGIGIGVATVFDHGPAGNSAAETFVRWLAQPAQGAELASLNSGLPSSPDQLAQAATRKQRASQPTYQAFASQLATGRSRPTIPAYTAISTALATELNAALTGTVSP